MIKRLDYIEGIRGWAALVVLVFHFTRETFGASFPVYHSIWLHFLLDGVQGALHTRKPSLRAAIRHGRRKRCQGLRQGKIGDCAGRGPQLRMPSLKP